MKNLILIVTFMLSLTACGQNSQDYASADTNDIVLGKNENSTKHKNNTGITPEVKKLKADLMKRTKDAFKEAKVNVPSHLEIVLIIKYANITEWIVEYPKNGKQRLVKGTLHSNNNALTIGRINYIEETDKTSSSLVYMKK